MAAYNPWRLAIYAVLTSSLQLSFLFFLKFQKNGG
jgi:hypothetical protein